MVRPGSPVVNKRGEYIGVVTSCALGSSGFQVGMAYVSSKYSEVGSRLINRVSLVFSNLFFMKFIPSFNGFYQTIVNSRDFHSI